MIKAVLFDMDGVLADTKKFHNKGLQILFSELGAKLTKKDLIGAFGRIAEHNIRIFLKKKGLKGNEYKLGNRKRQIAIDLMKKARISIFPGAKDLIKYCKKFKLGIGTSSSKEELNVVLKKISVRKYFKVVMGKENTRTHKPSPELYRKLAKKLKAIPSECVVIEDSPAGVEAAKRAKMRCIAVTNSFTATKLKKADLIVKTLKDKRIKEFLEC